MLDTNSALVLFSGGQDSTTCLAWALDRYKSVETVGFDYGQRHAIELAGRADICEQLRLVKPEWSHRLGDDRVLDVSILAKLSESALTAPRAIGTNPDGLPSTFVPGRNLIFLTLAAVVAYHRGIKHIVTGVCETDYSGYPDCRDDTVKAMQLALNGGMARQFALHTPLMWVSKAETWAIAESLGGAALVEVVRVRTHTCYLGDRTQLHSWGYGCGMCPACELRKLGHLNWLKNCNSVEASAGEL